MFENHGSLASALARRVVGGALTVAVAATTFIGTIPVAHAVPGNPSSYLLLQEQVASHGMIGVLNATADNGSRVEYIALGKIVTEGSHKLINIRVHTRGGSDIRGVLDLKKAGSKWYFYSVTRGTEAGGVSDVEIPEGITSSIVKPALAQQTKHQSVVTGLASGGYKRITVTGRHSNFGTRTINVKLSGGSRRATTGQIVSIRKTGTGGNVFWFLTDFR